MQAFDKKYGPQIPVLSGDFTEYWTDGLGAAAKQTAMNRASKERLIQDETLWTMLHPGEPAPCTETKEAWRNVSMGTEHTWCYFDPSKQPITNDILNIKFGFFKKADDKSKSLMSSALSSIAQNESSIVGVFNTLSWERSGLVSLSAQQSEKYNSIKDGHGEKMLSQRLSSGELIFLANKVPAFGAKNYILKTEKEHGTAGNLIKGNVLDNGIIRAVIDQKTGDIVSLLTNQAIEFVDKNAQCNLNSYRYLHGGDSPEKAGGVSDVKISIKENGPLLATILVEAQAEGCNSLIREITVIAGQPFIEIKNIVDKKAILEKEGVHFGFAFNINDPVTRADIPWGVMKVDNDQLAAGNRNWIGFQRWLDISNNEKGVTWCSLDAPVFEVGNMTANVIGSATDLPIWIKKINPSAVIYSWVLNNHWHTNFPLSQEGKLEFRYRILPHSSHYDAGLSNRFGLEQAQPLIVSPLKNNNQCDPLLSLEADPKVTVSILKTDSTGANVLVRIRSLSDKDELAKLHWNNRKPISVNCIDNGNGPTGIKMQQEVIVPAMGFITLVAKFDRLPE